MNNLEDEEFTVGSLDIYNRGKQALLDYYDGVKRHYIHSVPDLRDPLLRDSPEDFQNIKGCEP